MDQTQELNQPKPRKQMQPERGGISLEKLIIVGLLAIVVIFVLFRLLGPSSPSEPQTPGPEMKGLNNQVLAMHQERLFHNAMLEHKKLYWPSQFIYMDQMALLCVPPYFILYYDIDYPEMYQCEWRLVRNE